MGTQHTAYGQIKTVFGIPTIAKTSQYFLMMESQKLEVYGINIE